MTTLAHPLVDGGGPGHVVTETRARVVALTQLRQDLFIRAGAAGLRVVLVSDEQTRLTDAYRDVMALVGGVWVVRSGAGDLRDGISGRILDGLSSAMTEVDADARLAPRFLNLEQPDQIQFVVSASIRRRADEATRLGRVAETFATFGGASTPSWWGTAEPCEHRWDKDALTAEIRSRMPGDTRLIVTGDIEHPFIGSLSGSRTDRGVEEVFTGIVAVGSPRILVRRPRVRRRTQPSREPDGRFSALGGDGLHPGGEPRSADPPVPPAGSRAGRAPHRSPGRA